MRRSRAPKQAISKRAGPTCAPNAPTWWNNAQGLTPCDVYQSIMDKCGYTAPAITGDNSYYPVQQAWDCMCNTITYNLGSACQDCQRGTTDQGILFTTYAVGGDICPTTSIDLPATVVPTDDIPLWAYLDTSILFWTYSGAQEIASNSTTMTATPSQTSSPTSSPTDFTSSITITPTHSATPTSSSSPTETPVSSSKSINAGAIGGGVAGGVVLVLAVIGLLLFLRRRRARNSHGGPSAAMSVVGGGRNGSTSSESSLTESGKVAGSNSHYTPHSQMAQLNHNNSGVNMPTHSTNSALTTPVDAPPVPSISHEYTASSPSRSLAASPVSSAPPLQKVKRVPVRYSEDELAQAEEEARRTAQHQS